MGRSRSDYVEIVVVLIDWSQCLRGVQCLVALFLFSVSPALLVKVSKILGSSMKRFSLKIDHELSGG